MFDFLPQNLFRERIIEVPATHASSSANANKHCSKSGCRKIQWVLSSKSVSSALLLLSLTSCANDNDQFRRQVQEILSWSASAEMILDARLGARVPQGFTNLAVERCQKEISDLSSGLPQTAAHDQAKVAVAKLNELITAAHDEISHGQLDHGRQHLADLHRYEAEQRHAFGAGG